MLKQNANKNPNTISTKRTLDQANNALQFCKKTNFNHKVYAPFSGVISICCNREFPYVSANSGSNAYPGYRQSWYWIPKSAWKSCRQHKKHKELHASSVVGTLHQTESCMRLTRNTITRKWKRQWLMKSHCIWFGKEDKTHTLITRYDADIDIT